MCGIFSLSRCHFLTPVYFAAREESSSLCPNTFPTSYQLTQSIGQDREKYDFAISWRLTCPSNHTPNPETWIYKSWIYFFKSQICCLFWSEQWAYIFFGDSKPVRNTYLPIFLWNFGVGCFFAQKKLNAESGIVKNLEW